MAGTITHYYFAYDAIKRVKQKKNIIVNDKLLRIFAQSMDPFNFYSIYFPILPKSSEKRNFAGLFHHNNTNTFFKELINYIIDNHLEKNEEVMSFLYGFISHYVLDTSMHPFVEYKCGSFSSKKKDTFKYNAKHHEMETFIDIYMLKKHRINSKKFKSYKEIFTVNSFSKELSDTINYVFLNVFNFKNFDKYYLKSIKDMKFSFRLFRYDPLGYKKYLYRIFDVVSGKKVLNSKFLSYSFIPNNKKELLNDEHKYWYYPYDTSIKYNYNFDELYSIALQKCVNLMIDVTLYIEKKKELDIDKVFNMSYSSGILWTIRNDNPTYEF